MKAMLVTLRPLLLLAVLGCAPLASAQQLYLVEVVLFSQPGAQLTVGKTPPHDWAERAASLESTTRSDVRPIDPTRYSLTSQASQLSRQGYRINFHKAWTQPVDSALRVAVHEGVETDGLYPVQGLVNLSRERLLEADVSFWLNHASSTDAQPVSESLHQRRRLRLDETHYLDHQSMGVLIRVSRGN